MDIISLFFIFISLDIYLVGAQSGEVRVHWSGALGIALVIICVILVICLVCIWCWFRGRAGNDEDTPPPVGGIELPGINGGGGVVVLYHGYGGIGGMGDQPGAEPAPGQADDEENDSTTAEEGGDVRILGGVMDSKGRPDLGKPVDVEEEAFLEGGDEKDEELIVGGGRPTQYI